MNERYYAKYAAAAIRGNLIRCGKEKLLSSRLKDIPLDEMDDADIAALIEIGKREELKLYHFKRSDRRLPRVNAVMGFLKGICFESLLDVGSGRGVFLLPFLEEFAHVSVHSVDILDKRIDMLSDIASGGVQNLTVKKADVCNQPFADNSFDVVTMLEVLEHIPNVEAAIKSGIKMAKKYVVITVPSHEDDNPEHIHLLTKERLIGYFGACGITKLSFGGVSGHLFMIAAKE